LLEEVGADHARKRGLRAVKVIRDAVAELETSWTQLLGPRRFAQLRQMLQELGRSTPPPT
jgi:hypothetical protein